MNELHVVYGTGQVGTAVIELLVAQGKPVRVITRSGARKHLPPQVEMVRGDATDPSNARQVCEGATHVYNCTNPVDYHRWPEQFPPLQRGVLEGAAANGAKLIVMENLYMYGPHGGVPMTELGRTSAMPGTVRTRRRSTPGRLRRAGRVTANRWPGPGGGRHQPEQAAEFPDTGQRFQIQLSCRY